MLQLQLITISIVNVTAMEVLSVYSLHSYMHYSMYYLHIILAVTRRPASADRTARAANFRRDLEAT